MIDYFLGLLTAALLAATWYKARKIWINNQLVDIRESIEYLTKCNIRIAYYTIQQRRLASYELLENAVAQEDYERAVELQDLIHQLERALKDPSIQQYLHDDDEQ